MKNQKIALTAASLAAAMMLVACGGGGGGSSGGSAGQPVAPSVPASQGNLQTTVPNATYTGASTQASLFATLNTYRSSMGVGQLAQDTILDTAAQAHALYLNTNFANGSISVVTHNEVSGNTNYYEATPLSRARKAGAPSTEWISENAAVGLAQTSSAAFASDCLGQYLNTVYHLQGVTEVLETIGVGFAQDTAQGTYSCVLDFGQKTGVSGTPSDNGYLTSAGQQMATTAIAHVPLANETGVARAMVAELPNPAPDVASPGRPIMVRVTAADAGDVLTVSSFTLTSAGGIVVPARIIVPSAALTGSSGATADLNNAMAAGVAFLLPLAPLAANTTYSVSFSGARKGTPTSTAWSFTTGS
ncbi:CAP domain-containing protein [Paraburkholderia sediminicola]|uniref:CAP domain-containing protein n=1 Tax=Paraburkholderia sediminicola TaxID=458836 RepID=UPI0038BA534B